MRKSFTHRGAYALVIRGDKLLLILKNKGPYAGTWDLPGGRLEDEETSEEALIRELEEEVAIRPLDATFLGEIKVTGTYVDHGTIWDFAHIGMIYVVKKWDDLTLPKEEEDKWFTIGEEIHSSALVKIALEKYLSQDISRG